LRGAGRKLKSRFGWIDDEGDDDYGFSALPGGWRSDGKYLHIGHNGMWWTATYWGNRDIRRVYAFHRSMVSDSDDVFEAHYCEIDSDDGASVRCVQDGSIFS